MNDQLLREFLAEAEDLLEVLFGDLQALRARRGEGRARRELVGRIFRHIHTLKGSSATVGLDEVTGLAHEFEALLDGVRLGRVALDDTVLDAFDDAGSAISQSLGAAARSEGQPQTRALVERLRRLVRQGSEEQKSIAVRRALASLPEEIARSLSAHEAHRLQESIEEGARLFAVAVNFDLATFDARFRDLSDALAEDGEILSTLPGLETAAADQIGFRIIYATKAEREELAARINAFGRAALTELVSAKAGEPGKATGLAPEAAAEDAPPKTIAPLSTHVRVELGELDRLISAAHEVLVETTHGLQADELERVRKRLAELEENLIGLRMVAVGPVLERAARAGRIAARLTGKEVDFETRGADVRLDKSLADAMADPLLHILRNAVDHGTETPAARSGAGKPARARVLIEARAEGGRVMLKVTDDGRGIDPLRVTRAAAARGIIEAGRLLTKEQATRLIFRPGFSTAGSVSSVSGRGVGLDVVERAIELAGGELRVKSEPGVGAAFEIFLPTTLAVTRALVVHSAGHRYCVDERHVAETSLIPAREVFAEGGDGIEQVNWKGQRLPLVRLRRLLAQPPLEGTGAEEGIPLIIVGIKGRVIEENGMRYTALAVDAFGDPTEALVRGLGRYAARWRGVSGAAALPDGGIALVLDLPRLL